MHQEGSVKRIIATVPAALLLAASTWMVLAQPAHAADTRLHVNTFVDDVDSSPGDHVCRDMSNTSLCSLRAAVQEANALSGVTKITLDNGGTYKLTIAGSGENNAATGDIDIRSSVDMFGPSDGVSVATITANPGFGDRIFDIPAGTPSVSASFEPRILISGGQAPSTEDGGGIRSLNAGALFLNQM